MTVGKKSKFDSLRSATSRSNVLPPRRAMRWKSGANPGSKTMPFMPSAPSLPAEVNVVEPSAFESMKISNLLKLASRLPVKSRKIWPSATWA